MTDSTMSKLNRIFLAVAGLVWAVGAGLEFRSESYGVGVIFLFMALLSGFQAFIHEVKGPNG